jgi:hypothetical protein
LVCIGGAFSLVGHVMANGASPRSTQRTVSSHMPGHTANDSAFNTALRKSRRSARTDEPAGQRND